MINNRFYTSVVRSLRSSDHDFPLLDSHVNHGTPLSGIRRVLRGDFRKPIGRSEYRKWMDSEVDRIAYRLTQEERSNRWMHDSPSGKIIVQNQSNDSGAFVSVLYFTRALTAAMKQGKEDSIDLDSICLAMDNVVESWRMAVAEALWISPPLACPDVLIVTPDKVVFWDGDGKSSRPESDKTNCWFYISETGSGVVSNPKEVRDARCVFIFKEGDCDQATCSKVIKKVAKCYRSKYKGMDASDIKNNVNSVLKKHRPGSSDSVFFL